MNYHLRSKPKSKFSGKAIAIGVFFLILCGLAYLFPDVVRNTTRTVSLPFWHGSSALTGAYSHIKEFFIFKNTLISENAILKAEAASSTRSTTLSGKNLSEIYLDERFTAAMIASSVIRTP